MSGRKTVKKTRKIRVKAVVVLVLALLVLGLGGSCFYYAQNLKSVSQDTTAREFTVNEGESAQSILTELEDEGLIRNARVAQMYLRISGKGDFKAGKYDLNPAMNTRDIIAYLSDDGNAMIDEVSVTLVEGSWARDMANSIAAVTNVSAQDLLRAWNDREYVARLAQDYWFITPQIFQSEKVLLEGYLFPDTYTFYTDTDVDTITRKILDETENKLTPYREEMESSELGVHGLMTMASIIQFEGKTEEDMKLIASVFYNRLADGMRLQSSVTVCYALYDYDSWQQCEANTDIDSDYNTYQNDGLPPGPILNPGMEAIRAAMEPSESDYYYFIADVHGDGKIIFAQTYDEQLENEAKYLE